MSALVVVHGDGGGGGGGAGDGSIHLESRASRVDCKMFFLFFFYLCSLWNGMGASVPCYW